MDPQPGESVYDPTCGSGGLLLNCALHLKSEGKEYRTLKLYGQEVNLLTSAMARMNMFMHGIEEFEIVRGDTLANPGLLEDDALKTFNVILANPPYSIKSWDRASFVNDPYGRNLWGTPPQGCADYAFEQHIHKSMDKTNGRCIQLWPHGILFRNNEKQIRKAMIETDTIECVIALGKNLFYNSSMESVLLVRRTNKSPDKQGKILFINAFDEVKDEKAMAYLLDHHIEKIFNAYRNYQDIDDFARIVSNEDVINNDASLLVTNYVKSSRIRATSEVSFEEALAKWADSSETLKQSMNSLFASLAQRQQE